MHAAPEQILDKLLANFPGEKPDRIEKAYLRNRSWPLKEWRKYYIDHPLVSLVARRLIWNFTTGKK